MDSSDKAAENEASGPSPAYALAHYALRYLALSDPLRFLAILASPDANTFLDNVLQDVGEKCGTPASFTSADLTVHPGAVKGHPCAVIEFPEPEQMTEVYMVALVVLVDPSSPTPPDPSDLEARYFTLEMGFTLDDSPRTVLAEWTGDAHANYGDGPHPAVDAFASAIEEQL